MLLSNIAALLMVFVVHVVTTCEATSKGNVIGKLRRTLGDLGLDVLFEWDDVAMRQADLDLYAAYYSNDRRRFQARQTKRYRPGHSTESYSCDRVSSVPTHLRSASGILPSGLGYFYQKYTHAYGIPVLGSSYASDSSLKRACYVVRFLMADHSGVREWYYKLSGRVAVIGANEQTTQIPEHSWLPDWWNSRARGLGATESAPVSSGGEENLLCYANDRYHNEDIFLHEFSHGIHLLGAKYAIPGWESRLQGVYNSARSAGRWRNTYAMTDFKEYFAEGTQSYFNCNDYASPSNGIHNHVNTRTKLRSYDPALYNIVKEVFPCGNTYLQRCSSTRAAEINQQLRMNCDRTDGGVVTTAAPLPTTTRASPNCVDHHHHCASWAQRGECSRNSAYMLVSCKKSCNRCNGGVSCSDKNSDCAYWARTGECTKNPAYMIPNCAKSCNRC